MVPCLFEEIGNCHPVFRASSTTEIAIVIQIFCQLGNVPPWLESFSKTLVTLLRWFRLPPDPGFLAFVRRFLLTVIIGHLK